MANEPSVNYPFAGVRILNFWTITITPVIGTVPQVARAAGAAGVQHVVKRVTISLAAGANAEPAMVFSIVDGAAGPPGSAPRLWIVSTSVLVNSSVTLDYDNLALVGSAATALSVQLETVLAAGGQATVNLQGYDVL